MAESRDKHHLDDSAWRDWIEQVASSLGVEGSTVDVGFIHELTRVVAHDFQRPMAPVAAYIMGLALGSHPELTANEARDRILSCIQS